MLMYVSLCLRFLFDFNDHDDDVRADNEALSDRAINLTKLEKSP